MSTRFLVIPSSPFSRPFFDWFFFVHILRCIDGSMSSNFLAFQNSNVISPMAASFLLLIFFSVAWNSSSVNSHRLTTSWPLIIFPYWFFFWRWPWCNCYRRRKWIRRHEFKSWTWLIAFHIALIPLGKVWIQLFSFQLWVNSRTD